jgi:hypothetical protein
MFQTFNSPWKRSLFRVLTISLTVVRFRTTSVLSPLGLASLEYHIRVSGVRVGGGGELKQPVYALASMGYGQSSGPGRHRGMHDMGLTLDIVWQSGGPLTGMEIASSQGDRDTQPSSIDLATKQAASLHMGQIWRLCGLRHHDISGYHNLWLCVVLCELACQSSHWTLATGINGSNIDH